MPFLKHPNLKVLSIPLSMVIFVFSQLFISNSQLGEPLGNAKQMQF